MSHQESATPTSPPPFDPDNGSHKFTATELAAMQRLTDRMQDFRHIHFQTDNMFLAKYLRWADWDVERALELMLRVYQTRHDHPDWFALKRVSEYMPLLRQRKRYILAGRDRCGRRVFIYKMGNTQDDDTLPEMAQLDDMWYECMLTEHETQLNGVVVIIDCADMPWSSLKWCQPKWIRIGAEKSEQLPLKELTVHLVNQSTLLAMISSVVRPMLSKKLLAKFHFHKKGNEQLCSFVGREHLPEEYGGPVGSRVDHEYGYRYLLGFEEFLWYNRQFGIKK